MNRDDLFFPRSLLLLALLGAWGAVAAGRAFFLAGPGRAENLEIGEKIASFEGVLPAPRGRILDSNEVPLAWSERYFDLQQRGAASENETEQLRRILPDTEVPPFDGISHILKRGLSPEAILALEPVVKSGGAFRIVSRTERLTVSSAALRRQLGAVELQNGTPVGVSGLELQYDRLLTGKPGRFKVMLDRYRNWIESSWELLEKPVSGRDIKLDRSAEALERSGGGEVKP